MDLDDNDRLQVHYEQDVSPILDLSQKERAKAPEKGMFERRDDGGITLYARLPPVVIMELRTKYGVDIFKKDHLRRAFQLIDREYPHTKCVNKTHTVKG